eukprot:8994057-Ditylum_brightwellii.AAC.1
MIIGNTSELGDKDKLNVEPGQIVKTQPAPLLPASPSNTYLLRPNIKDTCDCAALDVFPLISPWPIHHPTLPTSPQHCIEYFNNAPCLETCLCNEASKGRHND